jgi:hypothetical protein
LVTLQELEEQVGKLAKQINASIKESPTFGTSKRDGTPHIEINGDIFYYMAYDRSTITMNRKTHELQELLYWIFRDITTRMGFSYELDHRDPKADFRRVAFNHQLELLEKLNTEWKEIRKREIEQILEAHPY